MVSVDSKTVTFSNGNANDGTQVNSEMTALFNNDSTLATAINNLIAGSTAFTGAPDFNSGLNTDTISEKTSDTGVTIDSLLIKDNGITVGNFLKTADAGELTISSGAVTATGTAHTIDTESDDASDDLDTINGGTDGAILIISTEADARNVVVKHNTGNIFLADASDYTMDTKEQTLTLFYSSALSKWLEVSRGPGFTAATQAQMEAATSSVVGVTPAVLHNHPAVPKVWVSFDGTGTPSIHGSYNVDSITDNGTGDYTINFTNNMADTNYAVVSGALQSTSSFYGLIGVHTKAVGSVRIKTANESGGAATDLEEISIAIYGDQ